MRLLSVLVVLLVCSAFPSAAQAAWPGTAYEDIWVVATSPGNTSHVGDQTTITATVYARVALKDVEVQFLLPPCAEFVGGDAWKNLGDLAAGEHRQVTVRVVRTSTERHTCKVNALGYYGLAHGRTVIEDGEPVFEIVSPRAATGRSLDSLGLPAMGALAPPNVDDYVFNPHTGKYERWDARHFERDPQDATRWVRRRDPPPDDAPATDRLLAADGDAR